MKLRSKQFIPKEKPSIKSEGTAKFSAIRPISLASFIVHHQFFFLAFNDFIFTFLLITQGFPNISSFTNELISTPPAPEMINTSTMTEFEDSVMSGNQPTRNRHPHRSRKSHIVQTVNMKVYFIFFKSPSILKIFKLMLNH